jgi:single-stranded DNA-specific DHH superfamily exonuclease
MTGMIEMKMINGNLINRFKSYIAGLKKNDRIAILHHTDPDGVSSAVIMNKLIHKVRYKQIDMRLNQKPDEFFITNETYKKLKKEGINKLIITDLSIDQSKNAVLKDIEKFADILIIDHHKLYNDLNSKQTIHIKPQLIFDNIQPSMYCTSKLVFDLGSKITDLKDLDWIAAIGIIGDNTFNHWRLFIKHVFKKYNIKNRKSIFETSLGKVTETLFFTEAYDFKKIGECFKIINTVLSYKQVLKSKLKNYKKRVEKEINYWEKNVRKFAEYYPKQELIFDYIKPKYSIKSAICSVMSNQYPNRTIVIAEDMKNDFIQLSVRRMDYKIAVNELLEKTLRSFNGANGGGHTNSAGGRIRKEDLYKFKSNVLNMLENRVIFR